MNKVKLHIFLSFAIVILLTVVTVTAYNGKYAFKLTSGFMSHTSRSDYVYKVADDEAPVVSATYVRGATKNFIYDVVNSNGESRVAKLTKNGTFPLTKFKKDIARAGYKYALQVKRDGGEFWDSAETQGLWNIDEY